MNNRIPLASFFVAVGTTLWVAGLVWFYGWDNHIMSLAVLSLLNMFIVLAFKKQ